MGHSRSNSSSDSGSDHGFNSKKHHKKHHKKSNKLHEHEGKLHGNGHHSHQNGLHGGPISAVIGGILGGHSSGHAVPAVVSQYSNVSQHSGAHVDNQKYDQMPAQPLTPPPSYSYCPNPVPPPPSGHRIPLSSSTAFPSLSELGPSPFFEADGRTPVYIGSALFDRSVHPCKIGRHLRPNALVPFGGREYGHTGRYDLLPFVPELMEFVPTSHGHIPPGRRPVEGGYEGNGDNLYHAAATIDGLRVPGKTGKHLKGCRVGYGGGEHSVLENYEILCWR